MKNAEIFNFEQLFNVLAWIHSGPGTVLGIFRSRTS